MKPILFEETETAFDSNGIGILNDVIDRSVKQSLNGTFEASFTYPVTGIHCEAIKQRSIILAKPDTQSEPQPFRVYQITKPSSGVIAVYARHIAYDLMGTLVTPFSATSAADALNSLKKMAATDCPFVFETDKSTSGNMTVQVPTAIWTLLGGSEGSILDVYGGEYEFDRFKVLLHTRRGADRGVTIRYGKNLTSLEQDENCANCYTGVYPYWADAEGDLATLPEKIVAAPGMYSYVRIMPLDLSQEWQQMPTEAQLRERAEGYVKSNGIGVPAVSWKIQFADLSQSREFEAIQSLERVLLGDTVSVYFARMGVSASARVIDVDFDPVLERYNSVTLGSVRADLADTIAQQAAEIQRKPSVSLVQSITMTLTSRILGVRGGAVRLLDTDGDGLPDTLYVADDPDPDKAVKVWRWNYEGWAGSRTGYNGPFTVGATLEDGLLAEAVTAAHLVAGTIQSADDGKTFFLDLDNGILKMNATELSIAGVPVDKVISDHFTQEEIFNALTNNGEVQGIYLQDGKIYINLEYLGAGQIKADNITLNGLFEVWGTGALGNTYQGGYIGYMTGTVDGGIITDGVALYNKDKSCYAIVTTAGVRVQGGSTSLYITKNGKVSIDGDVEVSGNITYTGSLSQA